MNAKALIVAVLRVGLAIGSLMHRGFSRIDTEVAAMREDIADQRRVHGST